MLTYQLQQRVYRITNNIKPVFPNIVEIKIFLEPSDQFGVISNPDRLSKTALVGHKAEIRFDANTGKTGVKPNPALNEINVIIEQNGLQLEMQGNKIIAKKLCKNIENLNDLLLDLHYKLPIVLNLEFGEPPVVKQTSGKIGESTFNWELEKGIMLFDVTNNELQKEKIINSFNRLLVIRGKENRRLASSFYHFYVAKRLIESGNSPYEYLSEVILNFCKVLQSLFGENRDDIRSELKKLGYSEEEIEETFIPIMILRNEFDVGHIFLKIFTNEQLKTMYSYLEIIEKDFKDMLKNTLDKIIKKEYNLLEDPTISLDKDDLKIINNLISSWESHLIKRAPK